MRPTPLSTTSLRELLDLFERSQAAYLDAEGQRLRGVAGWDFLGRTALAPAEIEAWTVCVGYPNTYPAAFEDDWDLVDLEEDDDPDWYRYQCPETFREVRIPAHEVAVREVRGAALAECVAGLLDIPEALRSRRVEPLLDGDLWYLGKMQAGKIPVDTWLARGLGSGYVALLRHLEHPAQPERGLILSAGPGLPEGVPPPRNYRVVPLRDVLVQDSPSPLCDVQMLHRILARPAGAAAQPSLPVEFDEITSTLTLPNRKSSWPIKGKRQAAFVRYLFLQLGKDRRWVPAHEVLTAVYGPQAEGRCKRVQELFRGSRNFADFIANNDRGEYGFQFD